MIIKAVKKTIGIHQRVLLWMGADRYHLQHVGELTMDEQQWDHLLDVLARGSPFSTLSTDGDRIETDSERGFKLLPRKGD